jgi:hypothetical protein
VPARVAVHLIPILIMLNTAKETFNSIPPIGYSTWLGHYVSTMLILVCLHLIAYCLVEYCRSSVVYYHKRKSITADDAVAPLINAWRSRGVKLRPSARNPDTVMTLPSGAEQVTTHPCGNNSPLDVEVTELKGWGVCNRR